MHEAADIVNAYWIAPRVGCVLFSRNFAADRLPELYLEDPELRVVEMRPATSEFFARFSGYYEDADGRIVFCQEAERHPQVDFARDGVRVAGPFNRWGQDGPAEDWQLKLRTRSDGTQAWECAVDRSRLATTWGRTQFKFVSGEWLWLDVLVSAPNGSFDASRNFNYEVDLARTGTHAFLFRVEGGRGLDRRHRIAIRGPQPARWSELRPGMSFFDLESASPMGVHIEEGFLNIPFFKIRTDRTVFHLFAPRARRVSVEIFSRRDPTISVLHSMNLMEDELTWELKLNENLRGARYFYVVDGDNDGRSTHFDARARIVDPWALLTAGPTGPAVVVHPDDLPRPPATPFVMPPPQDLTILECHVRDVAARAPIDIPAEDRLGFTGLTRCLATEGSYLRTLGVNAIELLPVSQFDAPRRQDYHWGYMTTNYFSPSSHYARAAGTPAQLSEFADLVAEAHRHGLAVILDVVYNHVGEPNYLLFIDKAYYFLTEPDGSLSNHSGCGNTLRAESRMARRLIIESLLHWVRVFDVDGFRFDLAELITVDVLGEIERVLKAVKPSIVLIAEPWSFRGSIAHQLRTTGFSFWNDGFRDFLPDYVHGRGNSEGLRYFMRGSLDHRCAWPAQSINYIQSHDDFCWIDKITERHGQDGHDPAYNDVARTHLALATLLCSIGTPMLAAGLDFLQSKRGNGNTYLRGDLNALDYPRLQRFGATHAYCREWLRFRASEWGKLLRLDRVPSQTYLRLFQAADSSCAALLFNADLSLGGRQILFAINPHHHECRVRLDHIGTEGWREYASRELFHGDRDCSWRFNRNGPELILPPLECGLWCRDTTPVPPPPSAPPPAAEPIAPPAPPAILPDASVTAG